MENAQKKGLNISAKSFVTAIAVIFALMVLTYVLTFAIPGGEYARTTDASGDTVIDAAAGFQYVEGGIPFWKWLLSPFLVLGSEGGGAIIAVVVFLLVIGGVFNSLEKCGLMRYMLSRLVSRFGKAKYRLLAAVALFFMLIGACIGSFEECVPLVPIVVAMAISLGWDALVGMGMSLLAVGCGFASGVFNPFTVGVAQELAGLQMFSGAWMRAIAFALIYRLLMLFLVPYAKRVDKRTEGARPQLGEAKKDAKLSRGLVLFASIIGAGLVTVMLSGFIKAIQDYTMIIVALAFLAAGVAACLASGMGMKRLLRTFLDGIVSIAPAIIMILMASSIKYTLTEAHILDSILHFAVTAAGGMPRFAVILFIYLIVLVMNFFIASGSAKAFLLIPLIVPMAQLFGISSQLCIMAFAFGDGFSNVFYPTNPVLLISLGLADVSYGKWVKWSWRFQLPNLVLTAALLLFGLAVGY